MLPSPGCWCVDLRECLHTKWTGGSCGLGFPGVCNLSNTLCLKHLKSHEDYCCPQKELLSPNLSLTYNPFFKSVVEQLS